MDTEKEKNEGHENEPQEDTKEEKKETEKDFFQEFFKDTQGKMEKENIRDIVFNYRVIHNHGIMAGDDATIENIHFNTPEKIKKEGMILNDEGRFNDWLSENYETYSMALLVATAVFDSLPYSWVVQATETLYQMFKKDKDKEEKTYALTEMLGQFGAAVCDGELNTYTGRVQVQVVQLVKKEYQDKILKLIWRECPQMHDNIMNWLEKFIYQKPISMSKRASEVMGQLICRDYYYFLNHMVRRLQQENNMSTDMLIAQNVVALYNSNYEENVFKLLHTWSDKTNVHFLLTGLLVCAELRDKSEIIEDFISAYVHGAMYEIQNQISGEYMQNIYEFFSTGVRAFTFYRVLIKEIYKLIKGASSKKIKDICKLFLGLFAVDITLARVADGEDALFIKLCMTSHEVSYQLCYIWQTVWGCRQYRMTFYHLLAIYVEKTGKKSGPKLEKFIDKVFGEICTEEIRNDICSKIQRRVKHE